MPERVVAMDIDVQRFQQRLRAFVARTTQDAARVVFETAAQVLGDTQEGWPVDTGLSRSSWYGPRKIAPLTYQIGNPISYSPIIEYGGWPGVGPLTHQRPGERLAGGLSINPGIYSRKKPSAPLRRALAKNYGRLTTEIRNIHQHQWGRE